MHQQHQRISISASAATVHQLRRCISCNIASAAKGSARHHNTCIRHHQLPPDRCRHHQIPTRPPHMHQTPPDTARNHQTYSKHHNTSPDMQQTCSGYQQPKIFLVLRKKIGPCYIATSLQSPKLGPSEKIRPRYIATSLQSPK